MHHLPMDSCGDATARSKADNVVRLHHLLSAPHTSLIFEQNVCHAVGLSGGGQAAGVIFDVRLLQSLWQEKKLNDALGSPDLLNVILPN